VGFREISKSLCASTSSYYFFLKNPGIFNLSNRSLRMKKKERKKQDKAQINIPINHIRVIKNYRMELFFSSAHNIFFFYNGWGLGKN